MNSAFKDFTEMAECYRKDATFYENNFSRECKNQVNTRRNSVSMKIAKAIFIGEASVGKTSLVMRYTHNAFDLNYKATIGVDFEVEKYSILQVPFTLQMWDTAGSERFQCIASAYYRGANTVCICFEYPKIITLHHARKWLDQAIAENPKQEFSLFLVGLKRDLVNDEVARQVDAEAVKISKNMRAEFWSISAANNLNVEKFFSRIACITFNDILTREDKIQTEKKVISPISGSRSGNGPKKIRIDKDFYAKTSDTNKCCQV